MACTDDAPAALAAACAVDDSMSVMTKTASRAVRIASAARAPESPPAAVRPNISALSALACRRASLAARCMRCALRGPGAQGGVMLMPQPGPALGRRGVDGRRG